MTSGHSDAQSLASECPDAKNYKLRLNPRSGTRCFIAVAMATAGVRGIKANRAVLAPMVAGHKNEQGSRYLSVNSSELHTSGYRTLNKHEKKIKSNLFSSYNVLILCIFVFFSCLLGPKCTISQLCKWSELTDKYHRGESAKVPGRRERVRGALPPPPTPTIDTLC